MINLYLIGNWKQHGSRAAIQAFSEQWSFDPNPQLRVAIAPPFPYLRALREALPDCQVAAQDCSAERPVSCSEWVMSVSSKLPRNVG